MEQDVGRVFKRILIANRGEIAVRVIHACRELGIESVAAFSDADVKARHVLLADHAVRLGPAAPHSSYLSIDAVIDAARRVRADAVHPGYGFLSENPEFALACNANHFVFIGPPADVIAQMGSKPRAREAAARAGVPVVPGKMPDAQTDEAIAAAARHVGLPVLLKPAEGGGGIGMKAVREAAALPTAIAQARREAIAAFGDGTLYAEKLLDRPRHIEIQLLADRYGTVVHLFERECSVQRRHQKVVEESPSTALSPVLRERMGAAAIALAKAAGYQSAGTVEFLLDGSGEDASFYFLEMNTRLQVEHPVTEQLTGVDLVRAQIAIASGEPLAWRQEQLTRRGHAIEARVYAEDPATGYLPQAGRLLLYREPVLPGVRVDSGLSEGDEVSVHYDPLLAKVIATGETRGAARRRLVTALRNFPILGIRTNISFLIALLEHPRFVSGDIDTRFLDDEAAVLIETRGDEIPLEVVAVAQAAAASATSHTEDVSPGSDPWGMLRGYRG